MTYEDLIRNMNPQMLSNAMAQMSKVLSQEQLREIEKAIKTTDKGELNQKLNSLTTSDLQRELHKNPGLARQLANNPELMQKINSLFKK